MVFFVTLICMVDLCYLWVLFSQTPHCVHMRAGYKYGNVTMMDTLLKDCLVDPFHDCHMGNTGMSVSCELW